MKKLLFFLLLMTAVVGRAQTSLDLLPVGTEAPDFTITDSKTGKKIFQLSDKKTQKDKDGKTVPGVWTVLDFWASWCPVLQDEILPRCYREVGAGGSEVEQKRAFQYAATSAK